MEDINKKETITIQDIAKKLNISASTVSRALKNNSRISNKTKKEVWQTARELGYQLNSPNYYFDSGLPKNIGVIVPQINDSLYLGVIERIQKDAHASGYNLIVSYTQNSTEVEEKIVKNFINLNLDGIIISLVGSDSKPQYIEDTIKSGIPLVCLHNTNFELPVPKIILDAYQGVFKAVKHLLSLGCKKISLMLGDDKASEYSEMLNGFKMGLTSSGIKFKKEFITYTNLKNGIEQTLTELFDHKSRPDAIITANSYCAVQTISFLKNMGIRIPQDVAVVSFGSGYYHKLFTPSITSIHYSAGDVGKAALKQLFELIEKRKKDIPFHEKSIVAPVKLVIRGSSLRD